MPQRPLVVVTDYLPDFGAEQEILGGLADLRLLQTDDQDEVLRHGADADVLLVFHTMRLPEAAVARLGRCRGIVRGGVGYDNLDVRAAGRQGIVICNVPDYGTEEVADHALMLLLATARRLLVSDRSVRAGQWDSTAAFGAPRLRGRTLGILGAGRIGSALALRARALGLRVVLYDPYRPDGYEKGLGVERCHTLEEFLPQAEFLSLHCPLTQETRHLLNAKTLSLLPQGAYLVNTARGACIDLDALYAALESGRVAFAGLDVVEREPLDHAGIREHPRVILTPHTAYYSVEGFHDLRVKGSQEARRMLTGEPVRNAVNLPYLVNPRCAIPKPLGE